MTVNLDLKSEFYSLSHDNRFIKMYLSGFKIVNSIINTLIRIISIATWICHRVEIECEFILFKDLRTTWTLKLLGLESSQTGREHLWIQSL